MVICWICVSLTIMKGERESYGTRWLTPSSDLITSVVTHANAVVLCDDLVAPFRAIKSSPRRHLVAFFLLLLHHLPCRVGRSLGWTASPLPSLSPSLVAFWRVCRTPMAMIFSRPPFQSIILISIECIRVEHYRPVRVPRVLLYHLSLAV